MANINTSTPNETIERVQVTKYDHLTTDELITAALTKLRSEHELSLALVNRLMDLQSELETFNDQREAEFEDACAALH